MPTLLARVDNRLVHGQVLEAWVPALGADTILVIDRNLADEPLQKLLIQALSHPTLDVFVMTPKEAERFLKEEGAPRKAILVFPAVSSACDVLEEGVSFERLNLGNIHPQEGSRAVTASVHVTPEDATRLRAVMGRGIRVEAQAVPSEKASDLSDWLFSGS